ncbi:unnamed protein product [Psylliodes chrysocephalus]|uniref:Protein ANTAGONIST OF LIKE HETEROCHROMATIN PROTEIN 1-like n=1 Tax=Psylliodes chrysocephalus TaxID=3402493 RepID=A0A9P0DEW9_9CUCU|nr:unnamed protein product [Psylliodes chrysocephala]
MFIGNIGQFENVCRMSSADFEILLNLIEPVIRKKDTNYRESISPKERLAVTLRFLATGDSFTSLMYLFKISKQSISTIVIEVCRALNEALKHQVQMPHSTEGWLQCAKEFEEHWNYPHCVAAMDGKHVMLQAPINSSREYYNYKSFFSIVLFALIDANYNGWRNI